MQIKTIYISLAQINANKNYLYILGPDYANKNYLYILDGHVVHILLPGQKKRGRSSASIVVESACKCVSYVDTYVVAVLKTCSSLICNL